MSLEVTVLRNGNFKRLIDNGIKHFIEDNLIELVARTSKYQGSFRYSGAKIWNTLPSDLTNVRDVSLFNIRPKKALRMQTSVLHRPFIVYCLFFVCVIYLFILQGYFAFCVFIR